MKEPEQKNQPSPAVLNSNDPYSIIQQKIRKDSSDQYLISQDPFKTNNNNSSTNNTNGNINYGPNPRPICIIQIALIVKIRVSPKTTLEIRNIIILG